MPHKRLGQHFLVDQQVADRIVAAAEITSGDVVLEVGPGHGALSELLARKATSLILIEIDNKLASSLVVRYRSNPGVAVLSGDAREFTPDWVPDLRDREYKFVANLPYYAASPIVRRFLETTVRPSLMVVTVQREVADGMSAAPGHMSLLSVAVQLYAEVAHVISVPPNSFRPPPRVDSAVVSLRVRPRPALELDSITSFFELVRAGFSAPRKQLRNSLARGLSIEASAAACILQMAGIAPSRRAATLSIEEWGDLYRAKSEGPRG